MGRDAPNDTRAGDGEGAASRIEGWTFEAFALSRTPLALTRGGETVSLRKQALRLLELMLENAGAVITHDQIRDRVWGRQVVDHTGGTHLLVREIRLALNDGAETGAARDLIETLPRQGYRFVGDTRAIVGRPSPRNAAIRRRVAAAVFAGLTLAAASLWAFNRQPTRPSAPSSPAQAAYVKGDFVLNSHSPEALQQAAAYFSEALRADPSFAPALVGLGEIARRQGRYDDVETNARAAMALNPGLGEPHLQLAAVAMGRDWDWEQAAAQIEEALAREPDLAEAFATRAALEMILDRPDESLTAARQAQALDPVSSLIRVDVGWMYYYARDFDTAHARCAEAERLDPDAGYGAYCRYKAARLAGDTLRESRAAADLLVAWGADLDLADKLRSDGDSYVLDQFIDIRRRRMAAMDADAPAQLAAFAVAFAEVGDLDRAATWLEKATAARTPWLPLTLRDPALDPLRDDPRLRAALRAGGLDPRMPRTAAVDADVVRGD